MARDPQSKRIQVQRAILKKVDATLKISRLTLSLSEELIVMNRTLPRQEVIDTKAKKHAWIPQTAPNCFSGLETDLCTEPEYLLKLIDLCVPITAESTFPDRFRGELYLSIPAMETEYGRKRQEPQVSSRLVSSRLVSSGRMSRHAMKIDRRKLRKTKNLIVVRVKMDTLIKSNEFCNATPFMNRPIEAQDQRSCSQPRKTEGQVRSETDEKISLTTRKYLKSLLATDLTIILLDYLNYYNCTGLCARTGVSTCATENGDDVDDKAARRGKEDDEGEMCSRHDVDTSRKKGMAHLESLDLEDGPRQAEREASRSSLDFPTRSQIPHFRDKRSTDDILIYTSIFGNRDKQAIHKNKLNKVTETGVVIAQVLDKWKEVGLIGRHYFFMAQLVLISEMQQFSCICKCFKLKKILDQQPTSTEAKLCRQALTSFTENSASSLVFVIMRGGSSRSLTFSVRSLAKVNRLNLYLDVGNRSRHHRHRSPERHRIVVQNRCNDCRRDSVPCHRRGTCSKTTSAWTPRSACRRCPIMLMFTTKFMLILMLQRTVYLHIGHIEEDHAVRSSAYLPSRVLFNESVGQLSSSELSLHCDTPSQRDSKETYVLCHQCCDVCFLSWESNPLRLRCLRSLLNQPNLHHRDVPYLICFVIVFVLLENQFLDDTDTRFGIWHFRLIKSMISFISNKELIPVGGGVVVVDSNVHQRFIFNERRTSKDRYLVSDAAIDVRTHKVHCNTIDSIVTAHVTALED
ncbi:hypothetical protein G5I_05911 [Acromyrmex echinatior]|uniref:Uncharacterized protein n=1 Tax=Acromyrmex echinatior TaxID=103372 RepID=F4WJN0_ACREC|nr:hypothetical protein G5I_05911 [Acromyrmex echinatior]